METNIQELFTNQNRQPKSFDQVLISIASPDDIHSWSYGEIKNPETINYRTFKPEKGGLFCERIFGPTRDWECSCGKYKRVKHKGVICDRCGVEVTLSRVRRERMGHIDLAVPISHIWFYKCMPSRLGLVLDMTARQLERIIYYEDYLVVDPMKTPLEAGQLLTELEVREAEDEYGEEAFIAEIGASAIQGLLNKINLDEIIEDLNVRLGATKSKQTAKKLAKRLRVIQGFKKSKTRPEWMILNVLPVISPDLRPLVPLEGGRFATSDLNDLYRQVINRNNRLKNLLALKTPEVIIRNEKRMLQEAVDALFDNGKHGRPFSSGNRPLKSLSDMLKGKTGRFRQNLLGKRVDYSGRSVIVVGPELKLHQCGLPKKMALTLFEPFIIRRLKELGYCHTIRLAKKMIDQKVPQVWDVLEEVTKNHPVLLNRAPTLHRLSIQAFEPLLIEGEAIRIHPLVCTAYNADFDGDQMAVHVPLSIEAQMEAKELMLATNNIFSSASGLPIMTPSQDIILGTYYLTFARHEIVKENKDDKHISLFATTTEVEFAIASRKIDYHEKIRLANPDYTKKTIYGNEEDRFIETTPGRVRFNEIWPANLGFINFTIGKKQIGDIISNCFQVAGRMETVKSLDELKTLGFKEATRSGISIGIIDMVTPEQKPEEISSAYKEIEKVTKQYRNGVITNGERYQKVVDIWTRTTDVIANALYRKLEYNEAQEEANPLYMMVDSGARGNKAQIKQLSGMRGLMAKPSGDIIERPIISNFREGLTVAEYFISTHGARKGLADTALKTADSGYMTRKLVDVAQDVIVTEYDCQTTKTIQVKISFGESDNQVSLASKIAGRISGEKIENIANSETIVEIGELIVRSKADAIETLGYRQFNVRSVLTCESPRGCCSKCYGLNLATGELAKEGEAVGIIAAQSIGEPGTQLTMRTFHSGGVAFGLSKQPFVKAVSDGILIYEDLNSVANMENDWVILNKGGSIAIRDKDGLVSETYNLTVGTLIKFEDGAKIKKGQTIATWDPNSVPIITAQAGIIEFKDMISGVTVTTEENREMGTKGLVVTEHREDLHPKISILHPKTKEVLASYLIPVGSNVSVTEKQKVNPGDQLARIARKASKTRDITGGLPRIAELFEARVPKNSAVISLQEGLVSYKANVRDKKNLVVTNPKTGEEASHLIPIGQHVLVHEGDHIERGESLTDGALALNDLLEACGVDVLQEHLVNEIQSVYRVQGVEINDKHIEVIIKQMLRKVKILEPGDSEYLWEEQIDRTEFEEVNRKLIEKGGVPAEGEAVLLGITKSALETKSFISAASFQDTTRVLTNAATLGKVDELKGFKENVIMGRLIPAGTGIKKVSSLSIEYLADEEPEDSTKELVSIENNGLE